MSDQPRIVARAAQPYVAVTERVTLDQFPGAIDRGFAEVFGWLAAHDGVSPAAAPLIRYVEVDMPASLLVELVRPRSRTKTSRAGLPANPLPSLAFDDGVTRRTARRD